MSAFIVIVAAFIIVLIFASGRRTPPYPDGKCYLCRQGAAQPGDTCSRCGRTQP